MACFRAALLCVCIVGFALTIGASQGLCRLAGRPLARGPSRVLCRLLLRLLRVRVVVAGRAPSGGVRLLVANHVSWIDILVLGSVETPCFLAKQEVASWPMIGGVAKLQDTVFVDRSRRKRIPAVNRAMAERMGKGRTVLLFPEGTTHDGVRRGRFRTAHLACLRDRFAQEPDLRWCAAQASALAYSDPRATWVGDMTLVPHLWAVLRGSPLTCRLSYGPQRSVARGFDRKVLGLALAADVEALLQRPAWEPAPIPIDVARRGSALDPESYPSTARPPR